MGALFGLITLIHGYANHHKYSEGLWKNPLKKPRRQHDVLIFFIEISVTV